MIADVPQCDLLRIESWPVERQRAWLIKCRSIDLLALDTMFETWAANGQIPPSSEGWRVWLMLAGRGYGKTRTGAEWIHKLAMTGKRRIALVGATIDEARSVMVEGVSGLINVARRHRIKVKWEPSRGRFTWPRGSVAQLFSGDSPEGLRGPEHDFAWCDELAKWRLAEAAWDNLQMGLRRGTRPRALVTTTPKPIALLTRLRADPWTIETGGKTSDNMSLPKNFVEVMMATYGGTRKGRQELDGELMGEAEGSLWPRALIERCRISPTSNAFHKREENFDRIVVGVDPPAGAGEGCDACGIIVGSGASADAYAAEVTAVAAASCRLRLRNMSAAPLSEAVVLNYAVLKAVAA